MVSESAKRLLGWGGAFLWYYSNRFAGQLMDQQLLLNLKLARTWASMVDRCYNSDSTAYCWYGERGIAVCDKWLQGVCNFIADMGYPPTLKHSIDRIDCNGNYEPSNCRWATQAEQNNNTRRSRMITWNNKTQSIRDWAKEYDIGTRAVSERLRRGWDIEKSLTTPGRMDFQTEVETKKKIADALWKKNGRLYQIHSKQKRGQRLSKFEQYFLDSKASEA
jgi:hypothetical protein